MTEATTADVETVADEAVAWRRLNPRMLLAHPVRELMRALPALVVLVVLGRGSDHLWSLLGVFFVVLIGLARWATTSYRVGPDHL